jgi:hypothetical protein
MLSPKIYFFDLPQQFWWAGGQFSLWTGVPKHLGWKQKDLGQFDCPRPIDWATGCAPFLRASALRRVGLFDEDFFVVGEDLDLSLRLRRAGYEIWYVPQAKLWHKAGEDTRRNSARPASVCSGMRNLLWIMHKHASIWQWATFWPIFLVCYLGYFIALNIFRGDLRSAWAAMRGVAAFGALRIRSSGRPAALEEAGTQKAN